MAGVVIALLHAALVLALLRSAQAPDMRHEAQAVDYIAFAFIAAPKPSVPVKESAPPSPPVAVPRVRPRPAAVIARDVAPLPAPIGIVPTPLPDAEAQPALATETRLDMASLRAAARQVSSERAPEGRGGPTQPSGQSGVQLRGMDDTVLSRAIDRAKTPDCQTKYAGGEKADLLLLVPLAIDTITGKGCKW